MASFELDYGRSFTLTLLTDDPAVARVADEAGIDRIGVDIERLGKAERQHVHPGARLSTHQLEDLASLAPHVRRGKLFCRLDPPHADSPRQIAAALRAGAAVLTLPYFTDVRQAEAFVQAVAGRAETVLLVETAAAARDVERIAAIDGVDEIMIGLNDLSWDLGIASRFELLCSPLLDSVACAVLRAGKRLGIGGLARWSDAALPIPPDLVYAQYPRLGATAAWVARSFQVGALDDLPRAVNAARLRLRHWRGQTPAELENARLALRRAAGAMV